jgi:hypothetical protein
MHSGVQHQNLEVTHRTFHTVVVLLGCTLLGSTWLGICLWSLAEEAPDNVGMSVMRAFHQQNDAARSEFERAVKFVEEHKYQEAKAVLQSLIEQYPDSEVFPEARTLLFEIELGEAGHAS